MLEHLEVEYLQKKNLNNVYYVDKYDDLCEKHFRIQKIIPLKKTTFKNVLNIILNIFTIMLINFLYGFFNKLVKEIKYTECSIEEADSVGIYCNDGQFYIIELKTINLPKVDNSDVLIFESNSSKKFYLFTFKLFSYIYNPNTNGFNAIKYNIYHSKEEIFQLMSNGLKEDERKYQKYIYGECDLYFHIDSFFRTLFRHSCKFFFVFQIYAVILWSCTEYYSYASVIAVNIIFDLIEATITERSNLKDIRKMARYSIPIKIYQKNSYKSITTIEEESSNLVPGDVFELPDDGMVIPCDCILLSGSVIINEAMLTGESTPIIKSHLPNIKQEFDEENDEKYFLFSGTKIVQKRSENKKPVIALVYSTGFNTVKGNLIRSILYPVQTDSKFENESAKFMIIMAVMCLLGYLTCIPHKIDLAKNAETTEERNEIIKEMFLKGFDLITTAVPPSLPCCLDIGKSIAQRRYKKKGIMCINRDKIVSSGKIDVCVFDKTGTLTEDHLNISGFLPVEAHHKDQNNIDLESSGSHNVFTFDQFYDSIKILSNQNFNYYKEKISDKTVITKKKDLIQLYIECLACCQGITRVKGKLIGDPIDVEMFESTEWELVEDSEDTKNYDPKISTYVRPKGEKTLTEKLAGFKGFLEDPENEEIKNIIADHYELAIVRRFDFSSKLQRMSTLVKNLTQPNYTCYVKGSPEKMKELCQANTIPADFNEQLNHYASRGYRVLALGSKVIQMDYDKALEVNRTFCEKGLVFLGLLIVQNKLKEATSETLQVLSQKADLRVRMATGDNIMTAVCVGRKCNLIEPNAIVYSCQIENEDENGINYENINGINTDSDQKKSIGVYENGLMIEKEKERKKKKLVWKTIESYKDEGDEKLNKLIHSNQERENSLKNIRQSTNRLSCLEPQEVGEEALKLEDEGNATIKVEKEDNKVINENQEEDLIDLDLSQLPFDEKKEEGNIEIAITGKNFETLYRLNKKYEKISNNGVLPISEDNLDYSLYSEKDESLIEPNIPKNEINDGNKYALYKSAHDAFRLVLKYCSIYARCSPENKTQIVQSLQKEKFKVLMCGDGANDCGALKVADVGVSLSIEEASIAAPFTSNTPDISCIIEVLKEGKCALVTSFQTFKYILLYSFIQFLSCNILVIIDSYLSNWEFMIADLFIITPLTFLLPLTPAYHELTYHRPVSSLFSFNIIFSMLLQVMLVTIFQVLGYFFTNLYFPKDYNEELFAPLRECIGEFNKIVKRNSTGFGNEDGPFQECIDNSSIFYISFAQYLILAVIFCSGKPFKKNFFYNYGMVIFSIIGFIYAEYIVFYVDNFSRTWVYISPFPDDPFYDEYDIKESIKQRHFLPFKYIIMITIIINFIVSLFFEKVIAPKCNKLWRRYRIKNLKKKLETEEGDLQMINTVKNYIREQDK